MDEFSTLKTLRSEVPTPSADELAPAFARLEQAMAAEATNGAAIASSGSTARKPRRSSVKRRFAWVTGSVGGVVALVFGAGHTAMAIDNVQAVERLQEIAGATIEFDEVVPGPGQYLLSSTRADWVGLEFTGGDSPSVVAHEANIQQIDVYMPADPAADWLMVRDWGNEEAVTAPRGSGINVERLSAPYGDFYAGTGDPNPDAPAPSPSTGWIGVDIAEIPTSGGEAAYAWIDKQYTGGSMSRDEDNFERIAQLLGTGLIPAPQRAALFEALALIPGVSSTKDVANLNGVKGIAFGRSEPLRDGERTEIIVDPNTGLVIGERDITGLAAFGFGANEVIGNTSVTTTVVDSAPSDAVTKEKAAAG